MVAILAPVGKGGQGGVGRGWSLTWLERRGPDCGGKVGVFTQNGLALWRKRQRRNFCQILYVRCASADCHTGFHTPRSKIIFSSANAINKKDPCSWSHLRWKGDGPAHNDRTRLLISMPGHSAALRTTPHCSWHTNRRQVMCRCHYWKQSVTSPKPVNLPISQPASSHIP